MWAETAQQARHAGRTLHQGSRLGYPTHHQLGPADQATCCVERCTDMAVVGADLSCCQHICRRPHEVEVVSLEHQILLPSTQSKVRKRAHKHTTVSAESKLCCRSVNAALACRSPNDKSMQLGRAMCSALVLHTVCRQHTGIACSSCCCKSS